MKKIAIVLGVAAVATLTGCRDQDYDAKRGKQVQDEPKSIETAPATPVETVPGKTGEIKVEEKHCTCAPGTKHTAPCTCGAGDCKCVVEKPQPVTPPAPAPEYTTYIVQNGDYLARISKKYNVTIGSIKRINNLKNDKILVGQKLKLPGKIDVGVQTVPATAVKVGKAGTTSRKSYVPYTGATKEYVVKNGDTLGSVAYGNGINIRQLKELNKLSGDALKVGQKLKVPAEKPVAQQGVKPADPKTPDPKTPDPKTDDPKPVIQPVTQPVQPPVQQPVTDTTTAPGVEPPPADPAPATTTYVVEANDDLTSLAVEFGVTPTVIRELNNLGENATLKPGQVIKLPAEAQQ